MVIPRKFSDRKLPSKYKVSQGRWYIGAIRQATFEFLLIFHRNYVSILHRFRGDPLFSTRGSAIAEKLSPRDRRDALYQLKCCPTVVQITHTDRVSA